MSLLNKNRSAYFFSGGTRPPIQTMIAFIEDHREIRGVESICRILQIALSGFCGCRPGSKKNLTLGEIECGLLSVRPPSTALLKAAGRYGDQRDRVQIYSASSRSRSP